MFGKLECADEKVSDYAAEELESMASTTMIPYRKYVERALKLAQESALSDRTNKLMLQTIYHMVKKFKENRQTDLLDLIRDHMDHFHQIVIDEEASASVRNSCLVILAEAKDERRFEVAYGLLKTESPEVLGKLGMVYTLVNEHIKTHRLDANRRLYALLETGNEGARQRAQELLPRTRDWQP